MPIPSPQTDEKQDEFISRCISAIKHADPNMSDSQVQAVCYSQWRGEAMHPDFQRILNTFTGFFTDGSGQSRFNKFVADNKLDIAREYNPLIQFNESFQWTKPLIRYYKQDKNAKYYYVTALTANMSMNDNDYRDYQRLKRAAPSMMMKPVNINHDHNRWQKYPRTRVDMVGMEDLAMELMLRVDNKDRRFQQQLDHDPSIPEAEWINHPSIQGYERPDNGEIEYLGCAFLERGYELPGDPLTEIVPLLLNESVRRQFCSIVDGQIICSGGENKNQNIIYGKENKMDLNEQNDDKKAFIDTCISQGKTREECLAQWQTANPNKEQMTETPPETTVMSDEQRVFMDECTSGGKSTEECAELWKHQLGPIQPPAATIPGNTEPVTPLSTPEPSPEKPLPIQQPFEQLEEPATVPAKPDVDSEYPTDSKEAFMAACLAANADSSEYCTNLWTEIQGGTPVEPWRVDRATKETEARMLQLSEQNVRLQSELAQKAKREVQLLNENVRLRENLSSSSKTAIMYEAEQEQTALLKKQIVKLREHIKTLDKVLSSTKDGKARELKEKIDENRRLERKNDLKTNEINELQEQLDRQNIINTNLRKDISDLTRTATTGNERARTAVKERSEIQIENAHLRDEAARLTRKISDLTQQRSEDAKHVYALEQRGLKLNEALSSSVNLTKSMQKNMKVMQDRMAKTWKDLNKQGIYEVDSEGNIIIGSDKQTK